MDGRANAALRAMTMRELVDLLHRLRDRHGADCPWRTLR
jgi:hypothetical protein